MLLATLSLYLCTVSTKVLFVSNDMIINKVHRQSSVRHRLYPLQTKKQIYLLTNYKVTLFFLALDRTLIKQQKYLLVPYKLQIRIPRFSILFTLNRTLNNIILLFRDRSNSTVRISASLINPNNNTVRYIFSLTNRSHANKIFSYLRSNFTTTKLSFHVSFCK